MFICGVHRSFHQSILVDLIVSTNKRSVQEARDKIRQVQGHLFSSFSAMGCAVSEVSNKLSDKAEVKRIPIHGLRHSHVSLLISRKYDIFEVSKRIGHKSVQTTQDIYGHLFDSVQKSIASDLDRLRMR